MRRPFKCVHCGSAGSIEFGMCQVCLAEYPDESQLYEGLYDDGLLMRSTTQEDRDVLVGASH